MIKRIICHAGTLLIATSPLASQVPAPSRYSPPSVWQQYARATLAQLIEINTTDASGNNTVAAEAMAKRLLDAGIPAADVQVLGPAPRKGNLVARLRSTKPQSKPLLLMAHLDVVEAKREDWSFDPFVFREQDGYFYGRGTSDDKAMAAIFTTTLVRMKQEGIVPRRDIILILTADEEGGDYNGVDWLLKNHRELVAAAFGINEGGGGQIDGGKRTFNEVQASEKIFLSFQLETTNPGGHSSLPVRDNAIYHVAEALTRIANYEFPMQPGEIARGYFRKVLDTELDDAAMERLSEQSAYYNALLRTTCVATMLQGGHAENALPQMARATVNCRLLPGEQPEAVQATLTRIVANDKVKITPMAPAKPSDPSPLTDEVMKPIERITNALWPGVQVVPIMATGATDGLYFRNAGIPIYGVSGIFEDINDVRAHGRDERLLVQSFYEGQEFLWRLVNALGI
ncbi:MAG: M20/M25/M40 family metallo-hydrolase [Gemmatimonadota bacterium]